MKSNKSRSYKELKEGLCLMYEVAETPPRNEGLIISHHLLSLMEKAVRSGKNTLAVRKLLAAVLYLPEKPICRQLILEVLALSMEFDFFLRERNQNEGVPGSEDYILNPQNWVLVSTEQMLNEKSSWPRWAKSHPDKIFHGPKKGTYMIHKDHLKLFVKPREIQKLLKSIEQRES
jgi:hypothetical protein